MLIKKQLCIELLLFSGMPKYSSFPIQSVCSPPLKICFREYICLAYLLQQQKKIPSVYVYRHNIYTFMHVYTRTYMQQSIYREKTRINFCWWKGSLTFIKLLLSLLNLSTLKRSGWLKCKPWTYIDNAKLLLSESLAVNFGYCRRSHWTAYSRTSRWTLWHRGHAVRRILTCWRKWSITRHT